MPGSMHSTGYPPGIPPGIHPGGLLLMLARRACCVVPPLSTPDAAAPPPPQVIALTLYAYSAHRRSADGVQLLGVKEGRGISTPAG